MHVSFMYMLSIVFGPLADQIINSDFYVANQ